MEELNLNVIDENKKGLFNYNNLEKFSEIF
jgi:hypothetical protein